MAFLFPIAEAIELGLASAEAESIAAGANALLTDASESISFGSIAEFDPAEWAGRLFGRSTKYVGDAVKTIGVIKDLKRVMPPDRGAPGSHFKQDERDHHHMGVGSTPTPHSYMHLNIPQAFLPDIFNRLKGKPKIPKPTPPHPPLGEHSILKKRSRRHLTQTRPAATTEDDILNPKLPKRPRTLPLEGALHQRHYEDVQDPSTHPYHGHTRDTQGNLISRFPLPTNTAPAHHDLMQTTAVGPAYSNEMQPQERRAPFAVRQSAFL